jgi:lysophospholipase L1-like esterase
MPIEVPPNATILFQGDSITDAGRRQNDEAILGTGYVMITAALFSAMHPEKNARFLNRGQSGNRIRELRARWQKDCIDLRPDIVSILIGINDTLRNHGWNNPTSNEAFETDFRRILEQTRDVLNAQVLLVEPFLLPVANQQLKLREDLNLRIEIVRKMSREFRTSLVPLDGIFARAAKKKESSFWSLDGVHPTLAGHALIAQSCLRYLTDKLSPQSWVSELGDSKE